jgi:hypothetical protein
MVYVSKMIPSPDKVLSVFYSTAEGCMMSQCLACVRFRVWPPGSRVRYAPGLSSNWVKLQVVDDGVSDVPSVGCIEV